GEGASRRREGGQGQRREQAVDNELVGEGRQIDLAVGDGRAAELGEVAQVVTRRVLTTVPQIGQRGGIESPQEARLRFRYGAACERMGGPEDTRACGAAVG